MPEAAVRELTFAQAVREALAEEMRRDPRVCILGEDVAEAGTPFKVLSGLVEEFGTERVMDTPISEAGFTGDRSRRGNDRHASGGRHHVRRFSDADDGSDGESGRQDSLHVGRKVEGARWCCALRWGRRGARPRNTRNRCTPGSATCPALKW